MDEKNKMSPLIISKHVDVKKYNWCKQISQQYILKYYRILNI